MNSLEVSVIIPVKNGAAFIEFALDSVFLQTVKPSHVIVVDDGSTDGTRELIEKKYGSMVTIVDGPQLGAGPARNVGIEFSNSRLIAFLDADDVWHPTKLQKQLESFEPGTVLGTYADFFVDTKKGRRFLGTSIRTKTDSEADSMVKSGVALPTLLSSWMFERRSFEKIGGFDPEFVFAQDFELAIRFSRNGFNFKVVRENLVEYRIHQTSETYTNYVKQRMFADYSRYRNVYKGTLPLSEWIASFWTKSEIRKARGGFYFRLGLGALGSRIPIRATFFLCLALLLDPLAFMSKVRKQANLNLLFKPKPKGI